MKFLQAGNLFFFLFQNGRRKMAPKDAASSVTPSAGTAR